MDYTELMVKVGINPLVTNNCPKCSNPVRCGIAAGENTCWCFSVQSKGLELNDTCMCKMCLTALPD